MSNYPTGVQVRGGKIRIYFQYEKKRCYEPVSGLPTKDNIQYAGNLVALIKQEIKAGRFDYAHHFPDSKKIKINAFANWLERWLEGKKESVGHETFRSYRSKVKNHILPHLGHYQPTEINYHRLLQWKSENLSHLSTKTIREILQILNSALTLCLRSKVIVDNPADFLEVGVYESPDPDPFEVWELEAIANTPSDNQGSLNMASFMPWTGLRPSETLGLAWEDVDIENELLYVRRALVTGVYKVTKTKRSSRAVDLLPAALNALINQRSVTGESSPVKAEIVQRDNRTKRDEWITPVFVNMYTGKPYVQTKTYINNFWREHLERAGVRYRAIDQCRHTFACLMLSVPEIPDSWIVQQMGHTDTTMLYKHYGKLMQIRNRQRIVDIAAINFGQKGSE